MRPLAVAVVVWAALICAGCCPHDVAVYASIGGDTSYAEHYRSFLKEDLAETFVRVNLGESTLTSAGLLAAIRDDSAISGALAMANVVTVNIGLRDVREARAQYRRGECGGDDNQDCLRAMVRLFDKYWADVAAGILRHVQRAAAVRTMELHHPWVGVDKATNTVADAREFDAGGTDFDVMREYIERLNASIRHHASAWNIGVAPAYTTINGPVGTDDPVALGYVTADAEALTTKGQEQIALALRRLGYAPTPEPFTLDGR